MNVLNAAAVSAVCQEAGFSLTPEQADALTLYLDLLTRWNRRINLVGTRSWKDALRHLVIDSFHLAQYYERTLPVEPVAMQTWDLGAGAGLPGIPLRMIWQRGDYWLVEAREKRALFLSTILARLNLPHTYVFQGRAEAFLKDKKADMIVSRAFMPWRDVLTLVQPHLLPGGRVILMTKEPVAPDESTGAWVRTDFLRYVTGSDARYITTLITG